MNADQTLIRKTEKLEPQRTRRYTKKSSSSLCRSEFVPHVSIISGSDCRSAPLRVRTDFKLLNYQITQLLNLFRSVSIRGKAFGFPISRSSSVLLCVLCGERFIFPSQPTSISSFSPRIALPAQYSGIRYSGRDSLQGHGVSLHPSGQDCAARSALPP